MSLADALVGREPELGVVRQLVESVARGASATLLIEGEAGIGKTQLVERVAAEAREIGASILQGSAHPFERSRPFGVIAEALDLRPRYPDPRRAAIGRLLVGEVRADVAATSVSVTDVRFRVLEEILDLVEEACSNGPVVLVLEDLHWGDDSSLGAIGVIVHELRHLPLLVAGTLRPSPRTPDLDVLIDGCVSAGARLLSLQPLTSSDVEVLVRLHLGAAPGPVLASIVEKAGGNPLWVVELLRSLSAEGWLRQGATGVEASADEVPSSLRDLILRRLGYLPAGSLELLQLASVLGDAVSINDLAAVSGRPPAEVIADLSEAYRARLLDERDDAVAFRHQLVQQAIYESLPALVRRARHRDAAGVLARAGAAMSKVATHLLRGADPGDLEAIGWLRRAATEVAGGAPSSAVELLSRAHSLLPVGHADADLVAAELADVLMSAGRVAEASDLAEAVLDRPHRDEADLPLRLALVSSLSLQNRPSELIARAESALESPGLQPRHQALVLTQASYGRTFSGDFVGGEATARRAFDLAERAGDAAMTVWSLCARSVAVKAQGRYAEACALTRQAVAGAFEPVDADARLRHPHFFLGMALADSDRIDEAHQAYARAIGESTELGTAWLLPDMLLLSAEAHFLSGHWDDAATEFEAGLLLARRHGQRVSIAQSRSYLALMAVARGDLVGARTALDAVEGELTSEAPGYGAQMVGFAASAIAEVDDDPHRALEVLLRFWTRDAERSVRYYHRYVGPPLVRLGLALDRDDVAREVVAAVEAGAALAPEVPTVQSAARRCRGLLDRDPVAVLEAVELARQGPRVLDHAGACEDAASVLASDGRTKEATELLAEARTNYDELGARALEARVRASLRRLGVRQGVRAPRRRAETGWDSLTTRERAVSELVAEGLTNRELARRLHISPHTVNTHLRHVFQKLSLSTRAELAARVARGAHITHSSDVSRGAEGAP